MVGDCDLTKRLCLGEALSCAECRVTKERQEKMDFIRDYPEPNETPHGSD